MATFKQMFPEAADVLMPPTLTGQPRPQRSELMKFRRQQLADLLAAYGIEHNPDGTKDELYPLAVAAEQSGRFQQPAKDPFRLNKASKNSDEWQMLKLAGVPFPPFEDPAPKLANFGPRHELQRRCKEAGINSLHMTNEAMEAALKAKSEAA